MKPALGLVAAAALLLTSSLALGDVAPPPDYVEQCTLANHAGPGVECQPCSTSFSAPNKCATDLAPGGFSQRCRTQGASVWSEVWCRPKAGPAPGPTASNSFAAPPDDPPPPAPPTASPASTNVGSYPPPSPELRGNRGCGSCSVGTERTAPLVAGSLGLLGALAGAWRLRSRRLRPRRAR